MYSVYYIKNTPIVPQKYSRNAVLQIMNVNPFVYMDLPPNLGIHAISQYSNAFHDN